MTNPTTPTDTLTAGRPERSVEELAELVRLHWRCLEMNGAKVSPVLKANAAQAVAEYEAALARQSTI
jgi:hypothetical protein